jgi:hypothetical protein
MGQNDALNYPKTRLIKSQQRSIGSLGKQQSHASSLNSCVVNYDMLALASRQERDSWGLLMQNYAVTTG